MEEISQSVRDFNLNVAKPYDTLDGDRQRDIDDRPSAQSTPSNAVNEDMQSVSDDESAPNKKPDHLNETADDDEKCQAEPPPARSKKKIRFVVRLRGLPWSARQDDIVRFFAEETVSEVQIVYLTDGRASGEALVEFADSKSLQSAFLKKPPEHRPSLH